MTTSEPSLKDDLEDSFTLRDEQLSLEDKLSMLQERSNETSSFIETLVSLKTKLHNKKTTIKTIIEKKIEDNLREVNKWKDLLFTVVDECIDEKIDKLSSQESFLRTTHKEMVKVLDSSQNQLNTSDEEEEEDETSPPQLEDLLALDLRLEPTVLTPEESRESDSIVKKDFTILLAEPKKSLRRTFAYVAGIIRGYLRRGKSNIDWIKS